MSHLSDCNEKKVIGDSGECRACDLVCMERPRYFCGQLLTDEDLNAEQRYQMEKNKLHNRYLHGWGVVCGLKVTCHPKCSSKGNVLVEKGYAIDCCGNDIILCRDETVDVIGKIKERRPEKEDECLPGTPPADDECAGVEKKYCLTIRYREEEAGHKTALKRDDEGCTVKRCEPSRIKEGHAFEVTECRDCKGVEGKAWRDWVKDILKDGVWGKIGECAAILSQELRELQELFGEGVPIDPANPEKLKQIYCKAKDYILDISGKSTSPVRCDIEGELAEIKFPSPRDNKYAEKVKAVFYKLYAILCRMVFDCICTNLLYPCPECSEDDKVVLACITVKGERIRDICNMSRRQVMTFPKLFYWLPVNEIVWERMNYVCCEMDLLELIPRVPVTPVPPQDINYGVLAQLNSTGLMATRVSENLVKNLTAPGVSVGKVYDKNLLTAKKILEREKVVVVNEVTVEDYGLKDLLSMPFIIPSGAKVDILKSDDKVVGVRAHREKIDLGSIREIVREELKRESIKVAVGVFHDLKGAKVTEKKERDKIAGAMARRLNLDVKTVKEIMDETFKK